MTSFAIMLIRVFSPKVELIATLLLIVTGCYGTPPNHTHIDAGFDAPGDGDVATGRDAATEADSTTCADGYKACDGNCIPAAACCGPCSCDGLPTTCGPNANENCCATVLVNGGTFNRNNDPTYPATLGDFHLDRFEVTVARFNRFIAAGQGLQSAAPQAGSGKSDLNPKDTGWDPAWNTYLATTSQALATNVQCINATFLSGEGRLPMNCINWYEAYAFCIWDGGRLPTDAEWTYAAVGGGGADGQRLYPWSVPPSSTTIDNTYAVYYTTEPAIVGSRSPKGDGKWQQADLIGNAAEWLADYAGAYPMPCYNCVNQSASERRVIRGGQWSFPALDNTAQYQVLPDAREGSYGARCARR